mgnify:CR=1 FL=1
MKKLFLLLLVGFFAVVVAACSNLPTLESISIEGQDIEFYVGEEFNAGDLKVVAKLSDASTEDVTAQATVSHEADMNKAGKYTVTVTYKDLTETYEITVIDDALVSLSVENLKTEYFIGEELSFEGAVAKETFVSGKVADADLASYEVVIADSKGNEYTGAFAKLGKNTVKLSKGAYVYEFDVNVSANVYNTIAEAVAAGIKNGNKVSNGTAKIDYVDYANEYTYAFGENFVEVQGPDATDYYSLLEDGSVFGVVVGIDWEGNPYMEPAYEPVEGNLNGVDFRSVLNYAYDIFGVESLVETFAFVGQSEQALNYKESKGENGSYNFSFEIVIEDFYYYFVEVSFVLDAEAEVFTEVEIKMDGYMYILNEETWEYEQPTEFVTPDFQRVISANQVIGAQVAVNPYPLEELLIQSFELEDASGNKLENGATVTAGLQQDLFINVVNLNPTTANAAIDQIKVTMLDEYGMETWSAFGDYYDGVITVTSYKAGKFQIVIASANVYYSLDLVVDYNPIESFVAGVYDENMWELVESNTAKVYANQVLQFGAIVNDGANPAVEVSCEGAEISQGEYFEFVAAEVGTYVITLTSAINPEFKATLTVEVVEAPSVAEILTGKYQYSDMMLGSAIYTFVPESEGAVKGQLTISYDGAYVGSGEGYFSYEYTEGWLSVMPLNPGSYNCPFSVELGSAYNLICTYNYYPQGELSRVEEAVEGALSGNYSTTFTHPMNGMQLQMLLSFNNNGTGFYSLMNGMYEGTFAYVNAEGVITFSEVVATFGTEVQFAATLNNNVMNVTTNFVMDGMELTLDYLGAAEETKEATEYPVVGENYVAFSQWGSPAYFVVEEDGTYTFTVESENGSIILPDYNYELVNTFTVELTAGAYVEIGCVSSTGNNEILTLTISKN